MEIRTHLTAHQIKSLYSLLDMIFCAVILSLLIFTLCVFELQFSGCYHPWCDICDDFVQFSLSREHNVHNLKLNSIVSYLCLHRAN